MSNPIPTKRRDEFVAYMREHDKGDEWALLDAAEEYLIWRKYRGDPLSAVNQYLKLAAVPPITDITGRDNASHGTTEERSS